MNWVERKHKLLDESTEFWNEIKSAIRSACDSYNSLFGTTNKVRYREEANSLIVEKFLHCDPTANSHQIENVSVTFRFSHIDPSIAIESNKLPIKHEEPISIDETGMFLGDVRFMTPDQLSRKSLSALFFPPANARYYDPK